MSARTIRRSSETSPGEDRKIRRWTGPAAVTAKGFSLFSFGVRNGGRDGAIGLMKQFPVAPARAGVLGMSYRRQSRCKIGLELLLELGLEPLSAAGQIENVNGAVAFRGDQGHFDVAAVRGDHCGDSVQKA